MACKTSYELHHQFPRLAEESGFTFNTHRPRVHIDWNKIKLIDLDSVIRERKFVTIEQHLNDILDCVFESEFDVRILDEGVMKMFRLAQLAVEYQQFCRHYLDRSVFVLREEITSLAQELDSTKRQLQEKEEEIKKIRRRTRHSFKTPLPYGNDNIAAMILKTLSNKGDVFPSTSNADPLHYNKCRYCDKVFMNQLYLQSHITRRHGDVIESPQKEIPVETNNENKKLSAQILELQTKLKEMEIQIANAQTKTNHNNPTVEAENNLQNTVSNEIHQDKKNMKDAEVSTNNEEYLLHKIEQWKKEENEKYNKEICTLRNQILESISSMKEKTTENPEKKDESNEIDQLQKTIKQQGDEIIALKQELINSKISKDKEDAARRKEMEVQISFWTKRAETQTKQYEALLFKLEEVAKDAKESRALAEIEKERASQLQILLQQNISRDTRVIETTNSLQPSTSNKGKIQYHNEVNTTESKPDKNTSSEKSKHTADRQTLDNLHRKAQELLNITSVSSTSTDSSSSIIENHVQKVKKNIKPHSSPAKTKLKNSNRYTNTKIKTNAFNTNKSEKVVKTKPEKTVKDKSLAKKTKDSTIVVGSPARVIRAKLTEEVNNRIVSFGVDPLKSRLPHNIFQKQRSEIQRLHEIKSKKNSSYEKIKYNILANIDSNTDMNTIQNGYNEYVSPNKVSKPFRSLTSVISNVKSKALSLVKLNDYGNKDKVNSTRNYMSKKAMSLLKTPPGSSHHSPDKRDTETKNDHSQKSSSKLDHEIKAEIGNVKTIEKTKNRKPEDVIENIDSDDSNESDDIPHVSDSSKSIERLVKSPARRPSSADINLKNTINSKYNFENGDIFTRTQSAINLTETSVELVNTNKIKNENSSEDIESFSETPIKKVLSTENIQNSKQTKGVLKNASSTSSLNKKKVLFDMDAIQMKSVSASPSQSTTEKSDGNEKYELGLVNLEGEEWDISSIENEPLKNDTKIQVNTRTSPKIAELKQAIESQLARRNDTPSTAIVGGVDILTGPMGRPPSVGGSNTSLGSSILDDSEGIPVVNHKAFVKPKKVTAKDDSDIDISEFSVEGVPNKVNNDF